MAAGSRDHSERSMGTVKSIEERDATIALSAVAAFGIFW